jgi:hypothetical protein
MSGHGFNERDVDSADETASGEAVKPIAKAIIAIANKHTVYGFRREVSPEGVIEAEVGRAAINDLQMAEIGLATIEESFGDAFNAAGRNTGRHAIAKVQPCVLRGPTVWEEHCNGTSWQWYSQQGSLNGDPFLRAGGGCKAPELLNVTERLNRGLTLRIQIIWVASDCNGGGNGLLSMELSMQVADVGESCA